MEVYVTPRLEARCPIGRSGEFSPLRLTATIAPAGQGAIGVLPHVFFILLPLFFNNSEAIFLMEVYVTPRHLGVRGLILRGAKPIGFEVLKL